jgi:hypothetical protein
VLTTKELPLSSTSSSSPFLTLKRLHHALGKLTTLVLPAREMTLLFINRIKLPCFINLMAPYRLYTQKPNSFSYAISVRISEFQKKR